MAWGPACSHALPLPCIQCVGLLQYEKAHRAGFSALGKPQKAWHSWWPVFLVSCSASAHIPSRPNSFNHPQSTGLPGDEVNEAQGTDTGGKSWWNW